MWQNAGQLPLGHQYAPLGMLCPLAFLSLFLYTYGASEEVDLSPWALLIGLSDVTAWAPSGTSKALQSLTSGWRRAGRPALLSPAGPPRAVCVLFSSKVFGGATGSRAASPPSPVSLPSSTSFSTPRFNGNVFISWHILETSSLRTESSKTENSPKATRTQSPLIPSTKKAVGFRHNLELWVFWAQLNWIWL